MLSRPSQGAGSRGRERLQGHLRGRHRPGCSDMGTCGSRNRGTITRKNRLFRCRQACHRVSASGVPPARVRVDSHILPPTLATVGLSPLSPGSQAAGSAITLLLASVLECVELRAQTPPHGPLFRARAPLHLAMLAPHRNSAVGTVTQTRSPFPRKNAKTLQSSSSPTSFPSYPQDAHAASSVFSSRGKTQRLPVWSPQTPARRSIHHYNNNRTDRARTTSAEPLSERPGRRKQRPVTTRSHAPQATLANGSATYPSCQIWTDDRTC